MNNTEEIAETSCKAWLLQIGTTHVAIGEFEMVHIIAGWQRYMPVPRSPAWCHHVFLWQERVLPLFDLETYINPAGRVKIKSSTANTRDITCVITYEDQGGNIRYGGLKLSTPPMIRMVTDNQICDYPPGFRDWDRIALSCFEDPDIGPVPILDIARIFCAGADISTTPLNSNKRQP